MAEIQDSEFLLILRESRVVSPEEVRSAQELQRSELDRQGSCRTLFSILCAKGLIDERVARSLRPSTRGAIPGDATPHTPTVFLTAPDDHTPSDVRRVNQPSTISNIRSARRRPPEVETAALNPKNTLGPYILVREVGKGGMGRVYYAWDENVGRFVALKVIDTEDQADRERFVREAQIAGRLSHPSIATVHHAGEVETRGYIAMQFIEGGPIDARKLPLLTALALIRDAAQALSYAHEQGVVHRDVKPGNLMIDGKGHVFLTDFGLAKEVVADAGAQLSITGTTFGTPQFMSPEQARGEHRKIDGRSDVYSLGATLYALLARRPPFTSTNLATLLLEVLDKKPPPLSRFNREISPELQMLVERAMAKDPAKRFPTMTAFAGALDRMIREGRYSGRYGMAKALAKRWLPRLAAAAALGAALWFVIPILLAPPRVPPPPPPVVVDPTPGIYASAVAALRRLEDQPLSPAERREEIEKEVLRPLAELLARKPGDLRAGATRVRALYAQGERALPELKGDDYRLQWIAALVALEKALEAPCPLPALEAPAFEWAEQPAPWPAALLSAIDGVARAKVAPDLADEYAKDRPRIQALSALTAGQAAPALRQAGLPVFAAAWCRAAYLDRRFPELRKADESKGRRERLGAGLALAAGSAAELQALLPEAGTDAAAIHAALARIEGVDPEDHLKAGLQGAAPEREAALVSARLQARAPTGSDDEKEYRRAIALAGDAPSTWPGRLAAVELRIGLGSRLLRSRGDGRPLLEEAVKRADELAQKAPGWEPPRLLGAQARLRLGRLDEARARLGTEARKGLRACLLASALELAAADRERKAGGSGVEAAKASQREALAAPGDPAEASMLRGAAALVLAQDATDRGKDEAEFVAQAVESLTRALDRVPGYIEARYHRASALFLRVGIEQRKGGNGRAEFEGMLADTDAAVAAQPEHLPARYLRGIANYHLGRNAEAVADWRALIRSDKSYDRPDVQSWILEAERRMKQ